MDTTRRSTRNWRSYNEHLVQRGEVLLDLDCLKDWRAELQSLNRGKANRPFVYPHSLILFLGTLKLLFRLGYRQTEGLARGLQQLAGLPAPDYSTLSRRLPQLDLPLGGHGGTAEEVIIAVDATGVQVVRRQEWMRLKRKGYVKIHVAVDVKTKQVLSLEITDDRVHDSAKFEALIEAAGQQVQLERVLADGAYDNEESFALLARQGIAAGIWPRRNACEGDRGARAKAVKACQRNRWHWRKRVGYGQRSIVESVFASFKAMFGSRLFSYHWKQMVQEIRLKIHVYNLLISLPLPS